MIHEHAITYKDQLSDADIDYMIKKGNHLGLVGREVMRVFHQYEEDKKHVIFEVTPMIPRIHE